MQTVLRFGRQPLDHVYLSSRDSLALAAPRRCVPVRRLLGGTPTQYLLASIDPPVEVPQMGSPGPLLQEVILAPRFVGETLFPIRTWPVFVHVARLDGPYPADDRIQDDQVESLYWGELYRTEEEARIKTT